MPNQHKFFQRNDLGDGFYTENTILKSNDYQPKVLIIGTYNPDWAWNPSDFFYGRGMYMWPIMANLFIHNRNQLYHPRNINNDEPTLQEVHEICKKGRISFADIIKGLKPNIPYNINNNSHQVIVNNQFCWCNYKDSQLDYLGNENWLDDNVKAISDYIINTPTLNHVYFTYKSGTWVVEKKNEIIQSVKLNRNDVDFQSIFTPSGQGFGKNLPNTLDNKCWSITHCWIWNDLNNPVQIQKKDYGHLDHNWLRACGVDPNNF